MVSPYDVLMIDEDADEKEIEEAYRERIKQTHPDQGGSKEEFQLVKSAYQEIQSDPSTGNRNTGGHNHKNSEELRCSNCDSLIHNVSRATYRQETDEIFCPDCVVDTYCRNCGKDLRLTVDQFSDLDGEPVCMSCVEKQNQNQDQNQQHATQNQNTTTTKKILDLGSVISKYILYSSITFFTGALLATYVVSLYQTGGTAQATLAIRQFISDISWAISSIAWLYITVILLAFRNR